MADARRANEKDLADWIAGALDDRMPGRLLLEDLLPGLKPELQAWKQAVRDMLERRGINVYWTPNGREKKQGET